MAFSLANVHDRTDLKHDGTTETGSADLASTTWSQMEPRGRTAGGGGTTSLTTLYHQIFDKLEQGEHIVETQGMHAALSTYASAENAADTMPRRSLEQQLAGIEQALHRGELNPQQERQLQQQALDLDSVIRASVFTRANLGLLMLRNGMKEDGVRMLLQAAQMDRQVWNDYQQMGLSPSAAANGQDQSILPMMKDDPNFQKHLASALADGFKVNGTEPQEIINILSQGFEGAQPGTTSGIANDNASGSGVVPHRTTDSAVNTTGISTTDNGAGATTSDGTARAPIAPGDATNPGNDYRQMAAQYAPAPGDSPAIQTLQAAEQAFEANPDKKAAFAASEAQFKSAQDQAEAAYAQLYPQLASINAQIDQQFPRAAQDEYKQLNGQIAQAVSSMSAADQQIYAKINGGRATQQEALAFLNSHTDLKQMLTRQAQLTQPVLPLLMQEAQIYQAMQDKILTGTMYARALAYAANAAGTSPADKEGLLSKGKDAFTRAFTGVPQDAQSQWLQDRMVAVVGTAVGAIAQPADAPGGQSNSGNPSDSAAGTNGQRPMPSSGDANVDRLVQTQNYGSLMDTAHRLVQQNKGDIQAAEPYYKAACFVVDSQDPAQIQATIQDKLTDLKRTDLTPQQRLQDHQAICSQIAMLSMRVTSHAQFAMMLNSAHRFADAQAQMQLAVDNSKFDKDNPQATTFNARQIQDEILQIQKDLNNAQFTGAIDPTKLNELSSTAQQLQQISQLPIIEREDFARFYLAGGKNPDGTPIGVPMVTGYGANGLPAQVTPQDNHILDPQKAADLINDAVRLHQQINQTDILNHPDLDTNLASLRIAVTNNAPENLKKQLAASSRYWQNTSSTFWSTAAGLAVAATLLYATKGKAASAFEELNAGRLMLAGGVGFGTSTLTNYGLQKGYYGRQDWTFSDSLLQGGGTFALAAGGLVLLKNGTWAAKATNWTAEAAQELSPAVTGRTLNIATADVTLPQMAMQFRGLAGQTAKLNEVVSALGANARSLEFGDLAILSKNGEQLRTLMATAGQGGKNIDAVALAAKGTELESLTARMAADKGLVKVINTALSDSDRLAAATSSAKAVQEAMGAAPNITLENASKMLAGNHLQVPPALAGLLERYPDARYMDLLTVAKNRQAVSDLLVEAARATNPATKFTELAAAAGGDVAQLGARVAQDANLLKVLETASQDAGLLADLGNVWGTTNAARLAAAMKITPTYLRGLQVKDAAAVNEALNAARQAAPSSLVGRLISKVTSPVSGLQKAEWFGLSQDVVPTVTSGRIGVMEAGMAGALPFNLGYNYIQSKINYDKGDSTVTPWQATLDSLSFTGGPDSRFGINFQNVIIQSLMLAPLVGGLKAGVPMMRSVGEAWQEARFAHPGLQNVARWGAASARAPLANLWNGGFNILNPGGAAGTYSQFVRQTLYPTSAYVTGFAYAEGATTISQQRPWRDSLENLGQPITNQNYYVPPTVDGNMQPVNANTSQPNR
jgi:hypothetical protein